MDSSDRRRKGMRLKAWATAGALAGLGILSGLAAASTRQRQAPAPATQVSRLDTYLGYPFWDTAGNKVTPPTYASSNPQTSSGGS